MERERATKYIEAYVESAQSSAQAERYARNLVSALTSDDYVESLEMEWSPVACCDVYAVSNAEENWYVKLRMDGKRLVIVSCHPLEKPIRLKNGKVIKDLS